MFLVYDVMERSVSFCPLADDAVLHIIMVKAKQRLKHNDRRNTRNDFYGYFKKRHP